MRKRDKMIKITLTEEEHELLKQQAQEMGMNKSAYIRHAFITTHTRRWKPIDWSPIIRDLEVVNEGMNRVAVQANATGYIDEAAYDENVKLLHKSVDEIIAIIQEGIFEDD